MNIKEKYSNCVLIKYFLQRRFGPLRKKSIYVMFSEISFFLVAGKILRHCNSQTNDFLGGKFSGIHSCFWSLLFYMEAKMYFLSCIGRFIIQ